MMILGPEVDNFGNIDHRMKSPCLCGESKKDLN